MPSISTFLKSRLRSSLLLSILLQCLEEEKAEAVRAVALRSLAGVVVLMEDPDKLPQLVSAFETTLRTDWSHAPSSTTTLSCPFDAIFASTPIEASGGENVITACLSPLSASCNWLLPTIAQWCLEVDSFNDMLLDPWLQRLITLCFVSPSFSPRNFLFILICLFS